jgi:hypothetical protein
MDRRLLVLVLGMFALLLGGLALFILANLATAVSPMFPIALATRVSAGISPRWGTEATSTREASSRFFDRSRGLVLIGELNASGPSNVVQLAKRTGLNRTTCYRLLDTLREDGYVTLAMALGGSRRSEIYFKRVALSIGPGEDRYRFGIRATA